MTAAIVLATAASADAAYMRNPQGQIIQVSDAAVSEALKRGFTMARKPGPTVEEEQAAAKADAEKESDEAFARGAWRAAYFAGCGALLIGGWLLIWLYQRGRAR